MWCGCYIYLYLYRTNQANELTIEQVSAWYLYRAHEMEKLSQLIDQSLDLTKFAMDNKVSVSYQLPPPPPPPDNTYIGRPW